MPPCIKLLLVVVVVASMLDTSISCSCRYIHEQARFCYGSLAYTFKVIAEEENFPKLFEAFVKRHPIKTVEYYPYPFRNDGSDIVSHVDFIMYGNNTLVYEVEQTPPEILAKIQEERRANSAQSGEVPRHERFVAITREMSPEFMKYLKETVDWPRAKLRYKVENFKLYQGDNTLSSNTSINFIHTPPDGVMCSTRLNVGSTYAVIGGRYNDGQLHMDLCDSYTDISYLNTKEREILRKNFVHRYARGCHSCKIVSCRYEECEGQRNNKECDDNDLTGQDVYDSAFQTVCSRRKSRCGWLRGSHMVPPKPNPSVLNDSNNH